MNNRRLLIATDFILYIQWKRQTERQWKTSGVDKKLCQLQLSKVNKIQHAA